MDSRSPRLQLQPAVTDIAPDIRDELKSDLLSISACKAHLEFIVNCVADMRGNNRYFTNTVLQIYGSTIDVKSSASKTFEDPKYPAFRGNLEIKRFNIPFDTIRTFKYFNIKSSQDITGLLVGNL